RISSSPTARSTSSRPSSATPARTGRAERSTRPAACGSRPSQLGPGGRSWTGVRIKMGAASESRTARGPTMTKLSVNVNKVATLRNTRHSGIPSVIVAARACLDAGAHGITIHPRPDERHIRPGDVHELAELLKGYPGAEFNIEGNPFEGR